MNLDIKDWGTFKVSDLFVVKYGVNLELNTCEETEDKDSSVNFVARTAENNGVSARVKAITGVVPQDKGLISVAGGGSVLSTFLQPEPFYSGRDLYTLESKVDISDEAKFFIITVIEQNKYKYSYGRQANKTLPDLLLKLPVNEQGKPDYKFMEQYIKSLHHKPLTTQNRHIKVTALNTSDWKGFCISSLFKVQLSKGDIKLDDMEKGDIPLVSSGESDNGIVGKITQEGDGKADIFTGNKITVDMFCNAFYQAENFYSVSHGRVNILEPKFKLTKPIGLFISTVINKEQFKFSYGRAVYSNVISDMIIKLPIKHNSDGSPVIDQTHQYSDKGYIPDWQFMEDYIKSLPYGERL